MDIFSGIFLRIWQLSIILYNKLFSAKNLTKTAQKLGEESLQGSEIATVMFSGALIKTDS